MPSLVHGTRTAYRSGCKCNKCRRWKAEDTAKYRASKRPPVSVPSAAKRATRVARPTSAVKGAPPTRILGAIERDLTEALELLGDDDSPWTKPLRMTALALAKSADEAGPEVVPRIIPQLLGVLERLGLAPVAPTRPAAGARTPENQLDGVSDDDDAAFFGGIRRAG